VHLEARGLFVPRIGQLAAGLPVTVFSPDAGGVKRAELVRRRFEAATGERAAFGFMEKHRSGGVLSGSLLAGEVEGRAVFIVDDMVSTGATMRRAAAACRERGARAVFALATHGLFGPGAEATLADPAVDRMLVTDSLPSAAAAARGAAGNRLEIVPAAPLLAEAIRRLHGGGSIADLLHEEN
jgi:ribose-phosphate pyrophosphokinase